MSHTQKIVLNRGVSVLELLIGLAIIAALSTLSWVSFVQFFNTHSVDKEASVIISTIAYGRSQSMSGKGDSAYGIRFASTTVTVFSGQTYSESSPSNVVRQLSSGVSISAL